MVYLDCTMSEALLAGYPVVVEQAVAWGEMDAYQHVNNVVYFRYFENSRLEYFRRLNWLAMQNDTGVGPILASTQARFHKPLTYPDVILIGARVVEVGEDRLTMRHRIVSQRLNAVATEGEGIIVTFDYARGVKAPVPAELGRRIAALEATGNHALGSPAV
jgi:acyl-CoA thioester hydrolase